VRGYKLALKISGCWRSLATLQRHCRIRSYLTSTRNHGVRTIDAVRNALSATPGCRQLRPDQPGMTSSRKPGDRPARRPLPRSAGRAASRRATPQVSEGLTGYPYETGGPT